MKFWITIGLLVFAVLLQGCDSAESSATSDDNGVVYCTDGNKADEPGCVPDPTKSPPGDDVWSDEDTYTEDDVYVETSVGCDNLEQIAGEWHEIHNYNSLNVVLDDLQNTCRVDLQGALNKPITGTDLPMEYSSGNSKVRLETNEGNQLILKSYYKEELALTQTFAR